MIFGCLVTFVAFVLYQTNSFTIRLMGWIREISNRVITSKEAIDFLDNYLKQEQGINHIYFKDRYCSGAFTNSSLHSLEQKPYAFPL